VTRAPERAAFLFDLDDTLFDHRYACGRGLDQLRETYASLRQVEVSDLLREYGSHMDRLHALTQAGRLAPQEARAERIRLLFTAYGEELSHREACRRAEVYRSAYLASERAVPGAPAVLRALWQRGHPVGVVTNNAVRG
jgi:phosphoglycolate phosphatase-like HAD superfamily hydrolase